MNFTKSRPTRTERLLALALSAGFLAFLPGCTLRDGTEPPENTAIPEKLNTSELLAEAFGRDNPLLPFLIGDSPAPSVPQPELSSVLTLPEKSVPTDAQEWIARLGDSSREILLTHEEITEYNRRVIDQCPTVVDIADPPETMSGQTVRDMIYRYSMPSGDRYTGSGEYITSAMRQTIEARRQNVPESAEVRLGIVTNRCDLKSIPTTEGFYAYGDRHYSAIQETELITGFPVWILHESGDGQFFFVQSYYYAGWVPADAVGICSREEFDTFAQAREAMYVTVTDARINLDGVRLDMGAVLPYLSEDETSFRVVLPSRDENGRLLFSETSIGKSSCTLGSLPYTAENVINQAFLFLGTPYGWGGADGNVDCSGFICAVFRCFGMYLPRNTGEQSKYNGEIVNLAGMGADQKYAEFAALDHPSTVHWAGHVMLYLGEKDGSHYVIHAPQGGETVTVMPLSMNSTYICAIRVR